MTFSQIWPLLAAILGAILNLKHDNKTPMPRKKFIGVKNISNNFIYVFIIFFGWYMTFSQIWPRLTAILVAILVAILNLKHDNKPTIPEMNL